MPAGFIDRLFACLVKRKGIVIGAFYLFYSLLISIGVWSGWAIYSGGPDAISYYNLGVNAGKIALTLFITTLIPGMCKRFGITHKILSLLMIFRRYIGISMYLFALFHFSIVKIIPSIGSRFPLKFSTFELFGVGAAFLLFFLFITSNEYSLQKLGHLWYRIHKFTYIAMWLIFFHVALQRFSIWTVLMSMTVFFEMASFLVNLLKRLT